MSRPPGRGGLEVIGNFYFAELPGEAAVNVSMAWHNGRRTGRLILSPALAAALADSNYPALDGEPLGLESALSYAVFIGLQAEIPVLLVGDSSVWNREWGELMVALAANDQPVVRSGSSRH
jgi:hypothetical protein